MSLNLKLFFWCCQQQKKLWSNQIFAKKISFIAGLLFLLFVVILFSKIYTNSPQNTSSSVFFTSLLLTINTFYPTIINLLFKYSRPIIPFRLHWPLSKMARLTLLLSFNLFDGLSFYLFFLNTLFLLFGVISIKIYFLSLLSVLNGSFLLLLLRFTFWHSFRSIAFYQLLSATTLCLSPFAIFWLNRKNSEENLLYITAISLIFCLFFFINIQNQLLLPVKHYKKEVKIPLDLPIRPKTGLTIIYSQYALNQLKFYFITKIALLAFLIIPKFTFIQPLIKFFILLPIAIFSYYFANYNSFNKFVWKYFYRTGRQSQFFIVYIFSLLPFLLFDFIVSSVAVYFSERFNLFWFILSWLSITPWLIIIGWITSVYFPKPVPILHTQEFRQKRLTSIHFVWQATFFSAVTYWGCAEKCIIALLALFFTGIYALYILPKTLKYDKIKYKNY